MPDTARLHELFDRQRELYAALSFPDADDDTAWERNREVLAELVEVHKDIIREELKHLEEVKA